MAAFNSILLRVKPCAKIHPKDARKLEAQMGQASWSYHSITMYLSFPSRSGLRDDVVSHWTEVNLLLPCLPSLLMCLQAACIHFPLFTGDTPSACWFLLAVGEEALSVGCLSDPYLSPNWKVTTSRKKMDITVDGMQVCCSSFQGGYCLIVLVYSSHMTWSAVWQLFFS